MKKIVNDMILSRIVIIEKKSVSFNNNLYQIELNSFKIHDKLALDWKGCLVHFDHDPVKCFHAQKPFKASNKKISSFSSSSFFFQRACLLICLYN